MAAHRQARRRNRGSLAFGPVDPRRRAIRESCFPASTAGTAVTARAVQAAGACLPDRTASSIRNGTRGNRAWACRRTGARARACQLHSGPGARARRAGAIRVSCWGVLPAPLPGLGDDVRPAPVPAQLRQRRPGHVAGRRARSASSASMALMCARMGPRTGEPGNARLRLAVRWRRACFSSLSVIALMSWTRLSGIGSPHALWSSHAGDAAHAGQHVPVTVVRRRRPLRPGPCLGHAGPDQFQPIEELCDAGR